MKVKLKWKIVLLCISIYIVSLAATGCFVTQSSYRNLLRQEVTRSLKEEGNVQDSVTLYLITNKKISKYFNINDYSGTITDMFGTSDSYIQVYSKKYELLSTSSRKFPAVNKKILEKALKVGKNYMLKTFNGKHIMYVTDSIDIGRQKIILSFVKDISYVDQQKSKQINLFINFGVLGVLFAVLGTGVLSQVISEPIENLSETSKKIASGKFNERAKNLSNDEIGVLAEQFNVMANEIESKILQLELESQSKQRFIDNLTHELRTPLTSIIGYSDILRKLEYDKKTFDKSLTYINSEGKRIENMVRSMMNMILLRNSSVMHMKQCSIKEFFDDIVYVMKVSAEQKNIKLEIEGLDMEVLFDPELMKEVFYNLIDNAMKASESGDKIIIGSVQDEYNRYLYIKDFGKGMDESEISKIMEPFYRVDKARARKDGGRGLGLSICDQIIKLHGFKIKVESEKQKGTQIIIYV